MNAAERHLGEQRLAFDGLRRRDFLALASASTAAALSGCATDPVTGKSRPMFLGESYDLDMDRKWAPHQFSSDYGAVQDPALNAYVKEVGGSLSPHTHRPHMPYSFRVVNSVVINGYTFPAGSMALTRGLLLTMQTEAELAAVLGHELGHVSAVHARERMQSNMFIMAIVAGVGLYLEHEKKKYAALAVGLGGIGANLLLMRYSRDNEREADELGMQYMVKGGYSPEGMVGLMGEFKDLSTSKPSSVDLLFSTHPMSDERYDTAVSRSQGEYAHMLRNPVYRERYMDKTAGLRRVSKAIEEMQNGEKLMVQQKFVPAEGHFDSALKVAPTDYAALTMMAKCLLAQNKHGAAQRYVEKAKSVYPEEAQASHLEGMACLAQGQFDGALAAFSAYERKLPGNPNTIFYKGFCNERMGLREDASREYLRYYQSARGGEFGEHVQTRLVEWKVIAPPQQSR